MGRGGRSTNPPRPMATPEPGQYEYIPGRGWFLTATSNGFPDVVELKSADSDKENDHGESEGNNMGRGASDPLLPRPMF
jgi:hypothetical protein